MCILTQIEPVEHGKSPTSQAWTQNTLLCAPLQLMGLSPAVLASLPLLDVVAVMTVALQLRGFAFKFLRSVSVARQLPPSEPQGRIELTMDNCSRVASAAKLVVQDRVDGDGEDEGDVLQEVMMEGWMYMV